MYSLDHESLRAGVNVLTAADPMLAAIYADHGMPPLFVRPAGFGTLVHIVLEQRISWRAAATIYQRLQTELGNVSAEIIYASDPQRLRDLGLPRTKVEACRRLAERVCNGSLDLEHFEQLDDQTVRNQLVATRGIGVWTANKYLMHALRRIDVWLTGDYTLAVALRERLRLDKLPSHTFCKRYAERWKGWRSVAVHLLWHDYMQPKPLTPVT